MLMEVDYLTSDLVEEETVEADETIDNTDFEGERCGICMDIIIDRGVLDCCQHWFCFGCIDNWSTITNLCPLCQNEFQSITCVPVYDTIGNNKVDEDYSFSRDDDWSIEGQSYTLSCPSYYIDENAVTCLDGDGCKIRSGLAILEEDSNLDTSIACDSCDVWYHAFCVGFDTEDTSEETWLCHRCTANEVPQRSDASSIQMPENQCDSQSSHPSHLTNPAMARKVSVSVADAGETAIVISMLRENEWTEKPSDNIHSSLEVNENLKVKTVNPNGTTIKVETPCSEEADAGKVLEAQGLELSLSHETSFSEPQPFNSLAIDELKIRCADEVMSETSSSDGIRDSLKKFRGSYARSKQSECESSGGLHLGLSVGGLWSGNHLKNNKAAVEGQVTADVQHQNISDESLLSGGKILAKGSKEAVTIIGIKREHADCSDNTGETNAKNEGASSKKTRTEENFEMTLSKDQDNVFIPVDSRKCHTQMTPSRDQSDAFLSDVFPKSSPQVGLLKDVKREQTSEKEDVNAFLPGEAQKCRDQITLLKDVKQKRSLQKEGVNSDIMSIVQGTRRKVLAHQTPANKSSKDRETVAGLRVKKIMKRASGDKESSIAVQQLRKEIREAVRNKSSADIGENSFDPKLLAAFRAAVAGSTTEPSMKLSTLTPTALKAKKSMLQKGKIRENLTKKIYGDSNGRRRRAWDRECEIEFWKHRSARATKPEKIATLESVLTLLRKDPSREGSKIDKTSESQATNPILSRLYLADTSVFPRKDDIKPLSVLTPTTNSEQKGPQLISGEKGQNTPVENCSSIETSKVSSKPGVPLVHNKGNQHKVPNSKDKTASGKAHPDRALAAEGNKSKASSQKETNLQSDDKKIDKRKWALEVLARKKAASSKTAAHEKQEDNPVLKGNLPLLAQLPVDMLPMLAVSCHNKIPVPIRQMQLHRLTEHLLKKVDLPEIRRTAETELAVADAVNIEKEIADKSNTKVVYLNLCSQEIKRHSDNNKSIISTKPNSAPLSAVLDDRTEQRRDELPTDPAVLEALRNAGLLSDSPPSSPRQKTEVSGVADDSPCQNAEEGPDNIFEMDSQPEVDIYGDFEYDLEDEDFIGATAIKVSKLPPEEGESRMKVVFSTLKCEKSVDVQEIENSRGSGDVKDTEDSSSWKNHIDDTPMISSSMKQVTEGPGVSSDFLHGEECEELSLAECEELYGPEKEPLINKFPEVASTKLYGLTDAEALAENKIPGGSESHPPTQAENTNVGSVRRNSNDENSPNHSQTTEKHSRQDECNADNKKQCDTVNPVTKKVEAYIKEHIRPLCKSGIITSEQYRWAVAKTTDKVMKYHSKDKNANFLIKEGEKVKKLAQQYVEAAQQKE